MSDRYNHVDPWRMERHKKRSASHDEIVSKHAKKKSKHDRSRSRSPSRISVEDPRDKKHKKKKKKEDRERDTEKHSKKKDKLRLPSPEDISSGSDIHESGPSTSGYRKDKLRGYEDKYNNSNKSERRISKNYEEVRSSREERLRENNRHPKDEDERYLRDNRESRYVKSDERGYGSKYDKPVQDHRSYEQPPKYDRQSSSNSRPYQDDPYYRGDEPRERPRNDNRSKDEFHYRDERPKDDYQYRDSRPSESNRYRPPARKTPPRNERPSVYERNERPTAYERSDRPSAYERNDRAPAYERNDRAPAYERNDRASAYERNDRPSTYERSDRYDNDRNSKNHKSYEKDRPSKSDRSYRDDRPTRDNAKPVVKEPKSPPPPPPPKKHEPSKGKDDSEYNDPSLFDDLYAQPEAIAARPNISKESDQLAVPTEAPKIKSDYIDLFRKPIATSSEGVSDVQSKDGSTSQLIQSGHETLTRETSQRKCEVKVLDRKFMSHLASMHPTSALHELCTKLEWTAPNLTSSFEFGSLQGRMYIYKAVVNGQTYQPTVAVDNRKDAKANAAWFALQEMGFVKKDIGDPL